MPEIQSKHLPIYNPDFDLAKSIYPFTMIDLDGEPVKLDKYTGHVCIVVNLASKNIFANHNYKLLNKLYDEYFEKGLRILAFPCNQFNRQEPGTREQIKKFHEEMGVKFDVFEKINVNCNKSHPLWRYMKIAVPNTANRRGRAVITEPFTKFVVNRTGVPCARIEPGASKDDIALIIEPLLEPLAPGAAAAKQSVVLNQVQLPPPVVKELKPCMQPWHFEPGFNTLI